MSKIRIKGASVEDLKGIISHDGVKAILSLLDAMASNKEKEVLTSNLNNESFSNIAIKLAKAQASREILNKLSAELDKLKGE